MKQAILAKYKAKAARLGVEIRQAGNGLYSLLYHGRRLRNRSLCAEDVCFWLDIWETGNSDLARWTEPDWVKPPAGFPVEKYGWDKD